MKSIIGFAALAALASAAPAKNENKQNQQQQQQQASNGSSIADPVAQAAIAQALASQQGGASVSAFGGQSIQQIAFDQALLGCNLGASNVLSANAAVQTVLIQGIDQSLLSNVVPFLGQSNSFVSNNIVNGGFANSGLLDINSLSAINGAFIDPLLGLQVVEVIQSGLGTVGIAPIVQGLAVNSGFPIIQNNQLIQVVSLDQAIAQNLAFQSLLTPVLVNGVFQQIFPIDQSLLLAAGGLLNGLPLVSGVNVAALNFNLQSNSVWNFGSGLDASSFGVLNQGVANVFPLSIGNPFFLQASSFFNSGSAVLGVPPTNAILAAPATQTVFLLGSGNVNFGDLSSLGVSNTINLAIPQAVPSFRKY